VSEALAQFRALTAAVVRESEGSAGSAAAHAPYAAFCALAVTRCEQSMHRGTSEAEALLDAGHSFVAAEAAEQVLSGDGFEHNVVDAVHCYELAAEHYVQAGRRSYAGTLYTELGNVLTVLGHVEEAIPYHQRAALLCKESPLAAIASLNRVINCFLRLGRHREAMEVVLQVVQEALNTTSVANKAAQFNNDIFLLAGRYCPHGAYRAVVAEAEVTALLLALRCSPRQRLSFPPIDAMYQRYTDSAVETEVPYLRAELALHLHGLVVAQEDGEAQHAEIEGLMWPYLTPMQKQLLHEIMVRGVSR